MNICMVLGGAYPGDVRVKKEARALLGAGHKIYLLSLGTRGMQAFEDVNGVKVIRIFPPKRFFKRAWRSLWSSIFFDDPFWRKTLEQIIKQYKIEITHCHDLPMVKITTSVARKFNIPAIADLHENFPEGIRAWRKEKISSKIWLYNWLTFPFPIGIYKKFEKSVLQHADRIITVIDEAKAHYVNDCQIPSERITIAMNTEDLEEFDNLKIDESLVEKYKDDFILTYIGGFGPHRGIETAIKSMPKIIEEIPQAKLFLVGGGPEGYEELLKMSCRGLKVENNIVFTGWVNFELVPSYIALSDVCLVPHNASGHTNTTIPHKLFQFMAMKKPVVVTDCKPLKRIVDECNCGIVVPSRDYNEMAKAVIHLYKNKEFKERLGENGRRAVIEKYNWSNEGKKLIELYKKIEEEFIAKKS